MSTHNEVLTRTFKMANGETTLNQYCVAVLDTTTAEQVKRPGAANAGNIAGVLMDATHAADAHACYVIVGVAKVKLGGNVSIGDILVVGGVTGTVVAKGTGAHSSGIGIVGRALAAGVSGDVIPVFLALPSEYSS